MLKKILWLMIIGIAVFFILNTFNTNASFNADACNYSWDPSIDLSTCLAKSDSKLVDPWYDLDIDSWFKYKILDWVRNIAGFLGLVAVWALVYAAFMMTISGWEEEKVKKAKDIVKWTLLWFLWVVTASSLIAIVVNFMYSF